MRGIEDEGTIAEATARWQQAFNECSEPVAQSSDVRWDAKRRFWGTFAPWRGHNINTFGLSRGTKTVEINVPYAGKNTNVRGVYAVDAQGARWLLRRGKMTVSGAGISEAQFRTASALEPVAVRFSDGSTEDYYPVTMLDQNADFVQDGLARFIRICERVRVRGIAEPAIADAIDEIKVLESTFAGVGEGRPERMDSMQIPGRPAIEVGRRHGKAYDDLKKELTRLGVLHSNEPLGGYGPDLYTLRAPLVLFEIKVDRTSDDVFKATGQLGFYERFLTNHHRTGPWRKVFVAPAGLSPALLAELPHFGIAYLPFEIRRGVHQFDPEVIARCLEP